MKIFIFLHLFSIFVYINNTILKYIFFVNFYAKIYIRIKTFNNKKKMDNKEHMLFFTYHHVYDLKLKSFLHCLGRQ